MVSPCCSHVYYGTSQPFILGLGSGGGEGEGGGGGLTKTEKQNHAQGKRKNWYTRKHGKTFLPLCKSHLFLGFV